MPQQAKPAPRKLRKKTAPLTATSPASPRGWMTVEELCEELMISRDTFYDWRKKGHAPKCAKLPNGSLRIRRSEFEKFIAKAEDNA